MADNLTISVGVDTAKMRADLAQMNADLQKATKQMNQFAKAGDTTNVKEAARNVDVLKREIIDTNRALAAHERALRGVGTAAGHAAHGMHQAAVAERELGEGSTKAVRETIALSREMGKLEFNAFSLSKVLKEVPKVAGPIAVVTGAILAANKASDEAAKNILALDNLSKATGTSKNDIVLMENAFRRSNLEAANLDAMLRKMSETFTKAHLTPETIESALAGRMVMRGGTPTAVAGPIVSRGSAIDLSGNLPPSQPGGFSTFGIPVSRAGQPFQLDYTKGLAALADARQYPFTTEGREKLLEAQLKVLEQINKENHLIALEIARAEPSVAGFKDPEEALKALFAMGAPKFEPEAAFMQPRVRDTRTLEAAPGRAEDFQIRQKDTEARAAEAMTAAGYAAMPVTTKLQEAFKNTAEAITELASATKKEWEKAFAGMNAASRQATTDIETNTNDVLTANAASASGVKDVWDASLGAVIQKAQDATRALAGIGGGGQAGQVIPIAPASQTPQAGGAYATGGIVGGSGSGDTVPAWLTPGEFVNRRASVSYYGAGLFSALNSRSIDRSLFSRLGFAVGGLVGDSAAHFADGGAVGSAAGGTPVHLHLDGQQYAMTASENVATALVASARRHQMRSTGVKPSWYGGRPGA